MPSRTLLLGLTIIAPLLLLGACDKGSATTNTATPDDSAEREAAAQAAAEQARQQEIEQERAKFVAQVDEAKAAFETDRDLDSLNRYNVALKNYASLSEEARTGVALDPYVEVMQSGAGQEFLDQLLGEWSNKKARTRDLKETLKLVHGVRVELVQLRGGNAQEAVDDGVALLSYGGVADGWKVGGPIWITDSSVIALVQAGSGREAAQDMCRAALDAVMTSDKKDTARQHYVMQACTDPVQDDWDADLGAWASAKETKAFRKAYGPVRAERDAPAGADE